MINWVKFGKRQRNAVEKWKEREKTRMKKFIKNREHDSKGHDWLYVSQRYGVEQKTFFESFRGCVAVGCYDIDYNEAYPIAIYHKDELVWHHTMDFELLDIGDFFVDYAFSEKSKDY